MSEFNDRFAELSTEQRRDRYRRLAEAALAHYPVPSSTVVLSSMMEASPTGSRCLGMVSRLN